jgi:hypothetical protein
MTKKIFIILSTIFAFLLAFIVYEKFIKDKNPIREMLVSEVSEQQAIEIVKKLSEVRNFLKETDEYNIEATLNEDGEKWVVWVYYLKEGVSNAYTFGYYEVDKNTGDVSKWKEISEDGGNSTKWLNYKDTSSNVTFLYPPTAKIEIDETDNNIVSVEFEDDSCTGTGPYPCAWFVRIYGPYPNTNKKPLEDFLISFLEPTYTSTDEFEIKKVEKISNLETALVEFEISKELDSMPVNRYFIKRDNDVIEIITGFYPEENSDGKEYQEIVDKVIDSLSLE